MAVWKTLTVLALALVLIQLVDGRPGHTKRHGANRQLANRRKPVTNDEQVTPNTLDDLDDGGAGNAGDDIDNIEGATLGPLTGDDPGGDDLGDLGGDLDGALDDDLGGNLGSGNEEGDDGAPGDGGAGNADDDIDNIEDATKGPLPGDDAGGDLAGGDDLGGDDLGGDLGGDLDGGALDNDLEGDLKGDLEGDDLGGDDLGGDNLGGDDLGGDDLGGDNAGGGGGDNGDVNLDEYDPAPVPDVSKPKRVVEKNIPQKLDKKRRPGLPARAVRRMIGLLRKAANHRRAAEQELLKVGSVLAKNGFVGHHQPQMGSPMGGQMRTQRRAPMRPKILPLRKSRNRRARVKKQKPQYNLY